MALPNNADPEARPPTSLADIETGETDVFSSDLRLS
jgi:hypothetical protein